MVFHFRINFVLFIYCANFISIFSNELIQTTENAVTKEKPQITAEELLRRRKILDSYLSKFEESQENWVETYSVHFSGEAANGIETRTIYHDLQDKNSFIDKNEMPKEIQPFEENLLTLNESPKVVYQSNVIMDKIPVNPNHLSKSNTDHSMFSEIANSKSSVKVLNIDSNANKKKYLKYKTSLSEKSLMNTRTLFNIIVLNKENNICLKNEIHGIVNQPSKNIDRIYSGQIDDSNELFRNSHSLENDQTTDLVLGKNQLQHQPGELQRRHKILKSYKSKFGKTEDWVETYDFILRPNENGKSFNYNKHYMSLAEKSNFDHIINSNKKRNNMQTVNNKVRKISFSDCVQVRLYVSRWFKKLLNKLKNVEHKTVSFSLSSESLSKLVELSSSENFDIISADEFVSHLISDLTVHQGYSWSWDEYIPSYKYIFYVLVLVTILFVLYSCRKKPFFLTVFIIIIMIISSIIMNYRKLYQKKVAEKHHTLSSMSSSHCVNILTANSGIYDTIVEYFRHYLYHEDCKKYYESLMVEPEYEINLLVVITDLIFNVFFSGFYVFADTLNSCVKIALCDTYFYQKIVIIFIFMFLMLIYFRYKIKLPFISLEPTIHLGSHAQDVRMPRRNFIKHIFSRISYQESLEEKNYIDTNKVALTEKETDNLEVNSSICPINTQCNPGQTSIESSKNEMTWITEQNEACADGIQAEIIPSEINNANKDDLQADKTCDLKDDSSCVTNIQSNHEQTCKSSSLGLSTSENYETICVGGVKLKISPSTIMSDKFTHQTCHLPTENSEH